MDPKNNYNFPYYEQTPLMRAASNGHVHVCEYLIVHQSAIIDRRDPFQKTALMWASIHNQTEVIRLLLDHKANIKAQDDSGGHAAYFAAREGNFEVIKLLVEKDETVVNLKGVFGHTPLIAASCNGSIEVCKYLVTEKRADVNIQAYDGSTALHWSVIHSWYAIVDILMSNGAKQLKNGRHKLPLAYAREYNDQKMIDKLEKKVKTRSKSLRRCKLL